ncbi:5'-methylthioadenosine/S-adenosylhomocysteine nucleosidase [Kitasatospora sp. NPDC058162]|uniref:5'-methylthioadenosine/S-adenosylhomocysteine nucleosidase n=1 Tax=Kitasatospora sp. NPDC058162 TaxID=3346362 RepID=UPI0036DC918E
MSGTVVILTALGLEYEAVQEYLTDRELTQHPTGTLFEVGTLTGTTLRVALAETGPGNRSAAVITEHARQLFDPEVLFFVGVAGALKDDIAIGDVVVATTVHAYHGGKDDVEGFLARPEGWPASHALVQIARHALRGPGHPHQVHFKAIAAGDVVLNSSGSPLRDQLHRHYNDAAAVEMESAGMAHAAHVGGIEVLTIRGISDRADGKKYAADDARNQPRAAANAAAAAVAVLRRMPPPAGNGEPGPERVPLRWQHLDKPVQVHWRSELRLRQYRSAAALELHVLPVAAQERVQMRRLQQLADELIACGRDHLLFTASEEVVPQVEDRVVAVVGAPARRGPAGLAVYRDGQRSAWQPLPGDSLGAILDPEHLVEQIAGLLRALLAVPVVAAETVALAVGVDPANMLSEDTVGPVERNRATMGFPHREHLRVEADDSLAWRAVQDNTADVAEELAARLLQAFRARS